MELLENLEGDIFLKINDVVTDFLDEVIEEEDLYV